MISAKVIADSKNEFGNRITTMEVVMPRMILAEFNTHRAFSRNSASSRAIPFKRMVKMVKENPFIPIAWMKDHSGMQGNTYITGKFKSWVLKRLWLLGRTLAVIIATFLHKKGLTKQLCNRLLEPFMWHTVLVTATEWENFFALRAHEAAEIHMQEVAYAMLKALNESAPVLLKPGEWHMPYQDIVGEYDPNITASSPGLLRLILLKIAVARCARLSYYTLGSDQKIDYEADIRLHDALAKNGHWSPFEHCAQCMSDDEYYNYVYATPGIITYADGSTEVCDSEGDCGWCGNFKGFIPYRKKFHDENRKDIRLFPV